MYYHWGQRAAKKERNHFEQLTSCKQKNQCNFDSGQLEQQKGNLTSVELPIFRI